MRTNPAASASNNPSMDTTGAQPSSSKRTSRHIPIDPQLDQLFHKSHAGARSSSIASPQDSDPLRPRGPYATRIVRLPNHLDDEISVSIAQFWDSVDDKAYGFIWKGTNRINWMNSRKQAKFDMQADAIFVCTNSRSDVIGMAWYEASTEDISLPSGEVIEAGKLVEVAMIVHQDEQGKNLGKRLMEQRKQHILENTEATHILGKVSRSNPNQIKRLEKAQGWEHVGFDKQENMELFVYALDPAVEQQKISIAQEKKPASSSRLDRMEVDSDSDSPLSSLSSIEFDSDIEAEFGVGGGSSTKPAAAKKEPPRPGKNKKSDAEIIADFGDEIWTEALKRARTLRKHGGVGYRKATKDTAARYTAMRKLNGKSTPLGSFSVVGDRTDEIARAMAIASVIMTEKEHGAVRQRDDAQFIADLPPGLWEEAQARALEPGPYNGVAEQRIKRPGKPDHVFYKAYISIDGKQELLENFSITADRDRTKARAMAIAARMVAEIKHGVVARDQAIIDTLPDGVWDAAQARANEPVLPLGVTFHPATPKRRTPHYQIHLRGKSYGAISVLRDRNDLKAKTMAIAARMTAELTQGPVTTDAHRIADFPDHVWEEAQARALIPGPTRGVTYYEATDEASARYVAGIRIENKWVSLASLSVTDDRDDDTARALAIATRRTAELGEAGRRGIHYV